MSSLFVTSLPQPLSPVAPRKYASRPAISAFSDVLGTLGHVLAELWLHFAAGLCRALVNMVGLGIWLPVVGEPPDMQDDNSEPG